MAIGLTAFLQLVSAFWGYRYFNYAEDNKIITGFVLETITRDNGGYIKFKFEDSDREFQLLCAQERGIVWLEKLMPEDTVQVIYREKLMNKAIVNELIHSSIVLSKSELSTIIIDQINFSISVFKGSTGAQLLFILILLIFKRALKITGKK